MDTGGGTERGSAVPGADEEVTIHEREVSRALRRSNLSGTFVLGKYGLSPYMACGHGCTYCDGRAERYYVEGDFERDIVARRNLPVLLAEELPRLRERGFVSIGSGISDAYQPVEARLGIMRQVAEVLADAGRPVSLMTKSSLVLRDLDLWREVNRRSRFLLLVSLVHIDDAGRTRFEPHAAPVHERLEVLAAFRAAGCATGILAMPLIPGVTDDEQTLSQLYEAAVEAKVDFVQPGGLTLRPGRQKRFFLERLSRDYPALAAHYADLYGEERASGSPRSSYTRSLEARCLAQNRRVGLPHLVPHRVYKGLLAAYDETAVLLQHMLELYRVRGVPLDRLRRAVSRYLTALVERKARYNRSKTADYRELSEEIFAPGRLEEILDNDRLSAMIRSVVAGTEVLDYAAAAGFSSNAGGVDAPGSPG